MTKFFSKAFEFFLTTSLYFGMGLLLLIAWQYILSISIFFGYVDATKIHTTWYEFFLLVTVFTFIMVLLTWWLDIRFSFRGKYIEPPKPCTLEPEAKFQYEGYAPGVVPEKLQHKSGGNVIVECGSGKCQVDEKLTHSDQDIEQMINDAGANIAPRVPLSVIKGLMERVTYVVVQQPSGTNSTMVHAYLDKSFYLATGDSHCVSAANFSAEIGLKVAIEKATSSAQNKLWELEGYSLYSKLRSEKAIIDKISENVRSDFILSVRSKRDDSRIDKPFITLVKLKDGTEIRECGDTELESTQCAMKTFNEYFDKAVKPTFDLHHPL